MTVKSTKEISESSMVNLEDTMYWSTKSHKGSVDRPCVLGPTCQKIISLFSNFSICQTTLIPMNGHLSVIMPQ